MSILDTPAPMWAMVKNSVNRTLAPLGLQVRRSERFFELGRIPLPPGRDPFRDMARNLSHRPNPVFFDVGANEGTTIRAIRQQFAYPQIHAFEPNPRTFDVLKQNMSRFEGVHLNNFGLGSYSGEADFYEVDQSWMCSFLKPDQMGWGNLEKIHKLPLKTLDDYCKMNCIERIDVLKTDTQGFDLEVLKGARRMLEEKRIGMAYMEIIFSKMYEGIPRLDETLKFLMDFGFSIGAIYTVYYENEIASWTDILFIQKSK